MSFVLNPWAAGGLVAMVLAWVMAIVVYFAGTPNRQTRVLAVLLFLEGATAAGGLGMMWSTDSSSEAFAWQMVGISLGTTSGFLYLIFLGTLGTPLSGPFRPLGARVAIVVLALVATGAVALNARLFAAGVTPVWWAPWEVLPGPWWDAWFVFVGIVAFFGLACAISAYRRAPRTGASHDRAKAYLAAFGVRDSIMGIVYFTGPLWFQRAGVFSDLFVIVVLPLASAAFVVLLALGVLRTQLFDLDVRIQRNIQRGTLAAVFLGAFLIVSQVIQNYFNATMGIVSGGIAAGLLLVALVPLQRMAERVSHAAVPQGRTSPEYLAFRKLDVYKAAVESVYETAASYPPGRAGGHDGGAHAIGLSEKERASLERLRMKLGLAEADARAIEVDAAPTA